MDVNFVRAEREFQKTALKRDKRIAMVTMGCMVIFVITFAGILYTTKSAGAQLTAATEAVDTARRTVTSLAPFEREFIIYTRKVRALYEIDAERQKKRQALSFFYTLFSDEYILASVDVDDKKQIIQFTVTASNVFSLSGLLTFLQGEVPLSRGGTMELASLSRSQDGKYSLTGSFGYAKFNIQ